MRKRTSSGQFERQRRDLWDGSNWNDGYVDNKGRFRVYRPDYPRAYALGYCLRAHIVWWLANGEPHPGGSNIHHLDEDKLNDVLTNLSLISHGEHSRMHNLRVRTFVCDNCGVSFQLTGNQSHGHRPRRFCSQLCYQMKPRSKQHKNAISAGLKRAHAQGIR